MQPTENITAPDAELASDSHQPPVQPAVASTITPALIKRRRRVHATYLVAAIVVLTLAFVFQVRGADEVILPKLGIALPPTCTMRRVTGVNCPGCGLTRSFICLARGDWRAAWNFNPAGMLFFVLTIAQVPYRSFQLWRLSKGHKPWDHPWLTKVIWILLGAALIQWGWRLVLPV